MLSGFGAWILAFHRVTGRCSVRVSFVKWFGPGCRRVNVGPGRLVRAWRMWSISCSAAALRSGSSRPQPPFHSSSSPMNRPRSKSG